MGNELYEVSSWQEDADGVECAVRYNKVSEIFRGHFPGNPIVPGVCTLQMVKDLLQKAVQKKLRLLSAPNVKFLQLITPDIEPIANITWALSENGYTASATLKQGAVVLFKMNALYAEQE